MHRVGMRSQPFGIGTAGRDRLSWIGRPRPGLRRLLGHALALVALLFALVLGYLAPPPTPIVLIERPGTDVVGSVAAGSAAWLAGVRPGLPAGMWPGGLGFTILTDPLLDIPYAQVGIGLLPLLLAACLATAGIACTRLGLPGGPLLATAAAATALTPVYPLFGLPAALVLLIIPGVVGLLLSDVGDSRAQRLFDAAAAFALGVLAVGSVVVTLWPDGPWAVLWMIPGVTAVAIVAAAGAIGLVGARRSLVGSGPGMAMQLFPLARGSWLRGAAEERDRLAIDLHNEVLPRLDGSIRTLESGNLGPREAAAELRRIAEDVRGLMHDRQLVVLETAGLVPAIEGHVDELARHGIVVALEKIPDRPTARPPAVIELVAYRIAQEAVWNSIRHAEPSEVLVRVESGRERVAVEVADDGIGLDLGPRAPGHVGMTAMQSQARAVGGRLDVSRRMPRGTAIRFEWPE
jgi:hypothetical protein